ncbi:MAG: hypothetical protein MUO97_00390, partial [Dehalococcoidia bacterium]|nr:hypothetical protein [Dehalococcoidia bacterium]
MGKSSLFVSMVVAISLVFTVSCVSKEVPVTETYYETEYRTETYTEIGEEHREFLTPKTSRGAPIYFKALWGEVITGIYCTGFEIDTAGYPKSKVRLILSSVTVGNWAIGIYDLTGVGQIPQYPPLGPAQWDPDLWEGTKYLGSPAQQEWLANFSTIIMDPRRYIYATTSDLHTGRDIVVDITGAEELMIFTHSALGLGPASSVIERVQLIWFDEVTKERQVPSQVEKQRTVTQTKKVPIWEVWKGKPMAETPSTSTAPSPAPPMPSAPELSFEACEYTNTEYGFSVKYPKEWEKGTALVTGVTPLFIAAAFPVGFPVGVPALIVEVAEGATFKGALTAVAEKLSAGSAEYDILPETTI